ncbi:hypothetical protein ACFL2H_14075 [Planctomycetota bacterium]
MIDKNIPWKIVLFLVTLLRISSGFAQEPLTAGLNQLEVIRPGTHERALPEVELNDTPGGDRMVVDIPRTLHVHRFYYDGDREYQGPIVQGGPITVVANHPRTGEQLYVDINLPNGAPIIAYDKSAITYVYTDRRVSIKFSRFKKIGARVVYKSGQGAARVRDAKVTALKDRIHESHQSSQLAQAVHGGLQGAKNMVHGTKDAIDGLAGGLLERGQQLTSIIPGAAALRSYGEDRAQRQYENKVRFAGKLNDNKRSPFVTTNR